MKLSPAPGLAKSSKLIFLYLIRHVSSHPFYWDYFQQTSWFWPFDSLAFLQFGYIQMPFLSLLSCCKPTELLHLFCLHSHVSLAAACSLCCCHPNCKFYSCAWQGWTMDADNICALLKGFCWLLADLRVFVISIQQCFRHCDICFVLNLCLCLSYTGHGTAMANSQGPAFLQLLPS